MAKSRDSGSLDSFNYVQAIKHATERTRSAPGASFEDGVKIAGRNVKVGADISAAASISASESMVLIGGAKLGAVKVSNAGKMLIPAGEKIEIGGSFDCAEIEIAGALRANIRAEHGAIFRAGSIFYGTYAGPGIVIEDGAVISAGMRIEK